MSKYSPLDNNTLSLYECEAPHYSPVLRHKEASARYECQSENRYVKSHVAQNGEALICCVGDMLCEEKLYNTHKFSGGFFYDDIFSFVRPVFSGSDLVIGNLETTVCESSPYTGEQYKIDDKYHCNAPVEFLDAIKRAGFDCLVMSNNHNCDSGVNGILETIDKVEQRGMMHTGVFGPDEKERGIIVDVNGIKIGLLSYSTWFNRNQGRFTALGQKQLLNEYSPDRVKADIKEIKSAGAEFVLVYMHWGIDAEYKSTQSASMEQMAKEVANAGADYIIGSHTHSVQPYERILSSDGRLVPCIFSMGNFVTSEITAISHENLILRIQIEKGTDGAAKVVKEEFIPCYIPNDFYGLNYPVIPMTDKIKENDTISKCRRAFSRIQKTINLEPERLFELTTESVYSLLGFPKPEVNCRYSCISYASDASKDCIALVRTKAFDPYIHTTTSQMYALADLAIKKGAKLLISSEQIKDYPCLVVDEPFDAFSKIVASIRKQFRGKVIGITGSIGKTSTTGFVDAVFRSKYNTFSNLHNANSAIYSAKLIQQLKPDHEVYVQEIMETPPYGLAGFISKMVQPHVAIVTVVGTSHMKALGSQERIKETCFSVEEGLAEDGVLVLNGDDPFQQNANTRHKTVYYSISNEQADFRAVNIKSGDTVLEFDILYEGTCTHAKINCFGEHNVRNAVAAFAAGILSGMTREEAANGLAKFRTTGIRQNLVKYGGYTFFMDCYNAAQESMESAFNSLAMIKCSGKRMALLADIKETGEEDSNIHKNVGEIAAASDIDVLFCYGDSAKYIAEAAKSNKELSVYYSTSFDEILSDIKANLTTNDVLLLKGSRSMACERFVDAIVGSWFYESDEDAIKGAYNYSDGILRYRIWKDHATIVSKEGKEADVIIPDYVSGVPITGVGESAFSSKSKSYTKSVEFPKYLTSIQYAAFYKTFYLESVNIPGNVKLIDNSAFSTCENLKSVVIEPGCMHLGYRAFGNCKNLESITIPETVKQIGSEAFINCDKLTIYGARNSYVEQYAAARKINFVDISRAGL